MSYRYVVIDDAPFVVELVRNILKVTDGVFVGSASNGDDGVILFEKTLPDLVILDMVMPKKNGVEVAANIRGLSTGVKIIGCSTIDDHRIIDQAIAAGCDDYLLKPFTKEGLLMVISRYFSINTEKNYE